jgi:hypothetical protein
MCSFLPFATMFKNEKSDLKHLATELCGRGATILILFSPKYHCKLASEGTSLRGILSGALHSSTNSTQIFHSHYQTKISCYQTANGVQTREEYYVQWGAHYNMLGIFARF